MPYSRIDPLATDQYAYIQVADSIAARIQAGEFTLKLPASGSWPASTASPA
jgi:hypothetical protein